MGVTIRLGTEADREQVLALAHDFHQQSIYGELFTAEPFHFQAQYTVALEQGAIGVAAFVPPAGYEGSVVIGFLALVLAEHQMSGECYASELAWWVDPGYRRGMVGLRLLTWAEQWAREHGAVMLEMRAPAGSRVGDAYVRLGYRPVESAFLKRL